MNVGRRVFCPGLDREISLPITVRRAVSLAPSLTDTVFRLGLGGALAGRSAWCHRPSTATTLPIVGSYTSINQKRLDALDPDLILMISGAQEELARRLAVAGYPVYQVPLPVSPWGILDNVATVAAVMGEPNAADEPLGRLHTALLDVHEVLPALRTYVEIDLGGPVTIGPGSYIYWALSWLGLDVHIVDAGRAYVTPDDAALAPIGPECIIYDQKPGRPITPSAVEARFRQRGLGHWFDAHPLLIVTEGDVLAHSGPWLIESGLPWLTARIQDGTAGPAAT